MRMTFLYAMRFLDPFLKSDVWKLFFWFAFPIMPFALYSLIRNASQGVSMKDKRVLLPLLFLSITLFVFGLVLAEYLPRIPKGFSLY